MRSFRASMLIIGAIAVTTAAWAAPVHLDCGTLAVTLDENTGKIVSARLPTLDKDFALSGGLAITEGHEARPIELTGGRFTGGAEEAAFAFELPGEGLKVNCTVTPEQGWFAWEVALENTRGEQRLLAVALQVEVPGEAFLPYYDGHQEEAALDRPFDGPRYRTPIPLCAAWSDQGGAAVGINPREHLSFIATRGQPLAGGGARIDTRTHIVLDPGQRLELALFMCGMSGEWGRGEALHYWYRSAPELFVPTPGIDPRVLRASAQYLAWKRNPGSKSDDAVREGLRRLHAGWDWCIGPYRRTGDIVGRKELWDYEPPRPDRMREEDKVSYDEWHAARKERFATGERVGAAMLFYTPSQIWCEEQLARERYADALTEDPQQRCRYVTGYIQPQDYAVRVFPYNTSFGEQSKKDLREVAEELGLYGFAFDTAFGPAKYRGPGMAGLPERGWDESGPFVREGVAIRRLIEYVHTLKNGDTTLAVIPNIRSSADYNSCLVADAALFEGEPWKNPRGREWALRDALGTKPACWWEHYALDSFVDYKNMTREQVAEAYQGMNDFMAIESLRMGFWPTAHHSRGFESMTRRYLPRIEACIRAGWQPVAAAKSDDFTWITRYGSGINTHFAIGNETAKAREGTLTLARGWLDEPWPVRTVALLAEIPIIGKLFGPRGPLIFTHFDGRVLSTEVREDSLTVGGVRAPRRGAEVIRACAAINVPEGSSVSASWVGDRVQRTLALQVRAADDRARYGRIIVPEGMYARKLLVDGVAAEVTKDGDAVFFACAEGKRQFTLEVEFASRIIGAPQDQLLALNFLADDAPAATIVLPENPTEAEKLAAERIQHYLQFYLRQERKVEEPTVMSVLKGKASADTGLAIVIAEGKGEAPKIELTDDRTLAMTSADADGLQTAVDELLTVLDEKYVAPPGFHWRRATNQAGLIGEWLPDPEK